MTRKRDEARVAEARRLHGLGLTTREIGTRLGVDPATAGRWTKDLARPRGPRPRTSAETDALIVELRSGAVKVPFAAIADEAGMSKTGARMRYYALTGRERPERRKEES